MLYLVERILKDGNISLPAGIIGMIIDYLFPKFKIGRTYYISYLTPFYEPHLERIVINKITRNVYATTAHVMLTVFNFQKYMWEERGVLYNPIEFDAKYKMFSIECRVFYRGDDRICFNLYPTHTNSEELAQKICLSRTTRKCIYGYYTDTVSYCAKNGMNIIDPHEVDNFDY